MATAAEEFIAHALTFVGYVEGPRSNETPFGARTGHQFQPWCDSWISSVAQDVGLGDVIPMSAYVPGRLATALRAGQTVRSPQRGDLVCFDWPPRDGVPDHIGIVLAVIGGVLHTVEGNTSPDNSGSQSNGGGVYQRIRPASFAGAYIRPPYPPGEWTVPLTPADAHVLAASDELMNAIADRVESRYGPRVASGQILNRDVAIADLVDTLHGLVKTVTGSATASVDVQALATALGPLLASHDLSAADVAAELAKRLGNG